jgi:hypothetical protein
VAGVIVGAYYVWSGTDMVAQFASGWGWGLVGALAAGWFTIRHVFTQPASPRHTGGPLVLDLLWPGLAYGVADAMLLSVLPVMVVFHGLGDAGWAAGGLGRLGVGVLGFVASMVVTFCYHIGYPEFRGKEVFLTLVGNGVMTLAFLVTGNPLAAVLPHAGMHMAAMWHGRETTFQLPPHYPSEATPV